MKNDRWQAIEGLFHAARELEGDDRTRFLDRECGEDGAIRRQVEALLAHESNADAFLEIPVLAIAEQKMRPDISALNAGQKLGIYTIVSRLGSGGMGEVYRARDATLRREVAIKVLPTLFTSNPERLRRLEREAHVLASLNHPNIASIHSIGEAAGSRFLVLELVEGETLAERIRRGPLPIDEALHIAKSICEALESAHEKGVIHRDLKPANLKITPEGTVKVLDFGLAKAMEEAPASGDLEASPAISIADTQAGVILGTPAYISPEQAKGLKADQRSDIFSFGAVLYEMLTGRQAFQGDNVSEVLASILARDPDFGLIPPNVNPKLPALLRRSLEKNPKRRWYAIGDLRVELEAILADPRGSLVDELRGVKSKPLWKRAIPVFAAAVLTAAITSAAIWYFRPPPSRISRTIASSGPAAVFPNANLAVTPEGRSVIYVGSSNKLFIHALDQVDATPLYTTPATPLNRVFLSPNGQWVGFVEGGTLKKVAITGGPAIKIAFAGSDAGGNGAAWATDDTIIFATGNPRTGLRSVRVDSGDVTVLTTPDPARGEFDHLWPEVLPGGRAVLFTITATTGDSDAAQVAVLDLDTRKRKMLLRGGRHAHYVPSGHLVYTFRGELHAVLFDLALRETRGTPAKVLPAMATSRLGRGFFDVAADGTLAYVDAPAETLETLVWVDRQGREDPLGLPPGHYLNPRVSPDEKKVAVAGTEILVWDLALQTRTPLKIGLSQAPVWTHNGRRLLFFGGWMPADRAGAVEQLDGGIPSGVTPDGMWALSTTANMEGRMDIMMVALDGTRRVKPLIQTEFQERNGVVSPNGRLLAYESNRSGNFEIYVEPFTNVTGQSPIPTSAAGGGTRPLWSRSGQELFYVSTLNGAIMAVRFDPLTGSALSPPEQALEAGSYVTTTFTSTRTYDVSPDGTRFLVVKRLPASQATQIIVVQNWFFGELKRLLPATR